MSAAIILFLLSFTRFFVWHKVKSLAVPVNLELRHLLVAGEP